MTLGILLEDFGLPTPGETLLITGSILASHGALDIRWLLLLAWAGAVVGDNIGFFIGKTGGHRLLVRYGGRIGITQERLQKVEKFFHRYGDAVIIFARFVVVLRQFNGIVAGTLEMHWARFLLFNAIGAALWVGFWGMLSFWLGKRVFVLVHALRATGPVLIALGTLAAVLVAGYFLWPWLRRTLRRRRTSKSRDGEA